MAQEKIIIKFEPKGDKRLIAAIQKLNVESKKLTGTTEKATKQTGAFGQSHQRLTNQTNKGAKAFATMRSNLLLLNFAMAMGVKQLVDFVQEAAKVEAMGRAFDTLSGGTENASIAMEKLQEATNGTMSRFDLFQQANNAMILGVSKNSDEMAEMFDVAQRLGQALGRDTASSVESLITGIGRQSRLMLDNIGIIVKAEEAYEAYANGLNKTVDQLTDTEKKQAFLNATMESARAKVASLDEEIIDMQMRMQKVSAEWANARSNLGNLAVAVFNLDKNLKILGDTAGAYNDIIDDSTIKGETWEVLLKNTTRTLLSMSNVLSTIATLAGFDVEKIKLFSEAAGEIGQSFEWEDLGISSNEVIGRVLINFDKYIQKQKEVEISNQNASSSYMNVADAFAVSAIAQEQSTKSIVKSSFQTGQAYHNGAEAAQAAGQQIVQSLIQEAVVALMADAVKKLGWIGVPLAGMAGAVVGSLVTQAQQHWKFEQGGLIGGRRHSQGGTMIEAEQGEFVMSRSAVDSVGIENLNRMNEGGGGGSNITLNISAPLVDDTVVDTIIPAINEAIRRGETLATS